MTWIEGSGVTKIPSDGRNPPDGQAYGFIEQEDINATK